MNPIRPISKIPIAETLAIVLYSGMSGFFKTCQTLIHFWKKGFIFSNIKIRDKLSF